MSGWPKHLCRHMGGAQWCGVLWWAAASHIILDRRCCLDDSTEVGHTAQPCTVGMMQQTGCHEGAQPQPVQPAQPTSLHG